MVPACRSSGFIAESRAETGLVRTPDAAAFTNHYVTVTHALLREIQAESVLRPVNTCGETSTVFLQN